MANPIQQGLKLLNPCSCVVWLYAAMANPIQQGLKHHSVKGADGKWRPAAMANPIQQGLKLVWRKKGH